MSGLGFQGLRFMGPAGLLPGRHPSKPVAKKGKLTVRFLAYFFQAVLQRAPENRGSLSRTPYIRDHGLLGSERRILFFIK